MHSCKIPYFVAKFEVKDHQSSNPFQFSSPLFTDSQLWTLPIDTALMACYVLYVNHPSTHTHTHKDWWCYLFSVVLIILTIVSFFYWSTLTNAYHPKTLPHISENFVGRKEDINEIIKLINFKKSDLRIINIIGPPGFGKSTLAIHVGHEMVRNAIVYYLNVAEFSDQAIKTALAVKILDDPNRVGKQITFEQLLKWTRNRSWYTLLILDNCDDILNNQRDEFQDAIVKIVEESLYVKVLITSRRIATFTKYFAWHGIEELSIEAACELLDHKIPTGTGISNEQKKQIATLTGNVPLALHSVGSLLQLPASPSPKAIIEKLDKEPILTLSSKELPPRERLYGIISISYNYLSKEMQTASHLLTIFPGSFDLFAVFTIFRYGSILYGYQYNSTGAEEIVRYLVHCSLLEYHKHDDRYCFHKLIKEFLLLIQRNEWPHEAKKLTSAVHIHYAKQLTIASNHFKKYNFWPSLEFLYLEHHNLEHLLYGIKNMLPVSRDHLIIHAEEFLEAAVALASALDVRLMQSSFSTTTLCDSVEHCVTQLDKIMPYLDYYLHVLQQKRFTQERILHFYLMLIRQLAVCEEELVGTRAAVKVYVHRKHIIETKGSIMGFEKYITFYTELCSYYHRCGQDEDVVECHKLIMQRTEVHLDRCQPYNQCNYYAVGNVYSAMNQYEAALYFFKLSFKMENDTPVKLQKLKATYSELVSPQRLAPTIKALSAYDIFILSLTIFIGVLQFLWDGIILLMHLLCAIFYISMMYPHIIFITCCILSLIYYYC